MYSVKISTWYFGLVEFAGIAATGAIIGFGGYLVHQGTATIGTVTAFVLLLANLFDPVQQLSQLYNTVQSSTAALHKLFVIIDAVPDVDEVAHPTELSTRGALVVDHVTFAYAGNDRSVLKDVTISVADGERLALVGPTGAGKSTLAKLMARLYDPSESNGHRGTVSYGGVDLRQASIRTFDGGLSWFPKKVFVSLDQFAKTSVLHDQQPVTARLKRPWSPLVHWNALWNFQRDLTPMFVSEDLDCQRANGN